MNSDNFNIRVSVGLPWKTAGPSETIFSSHFPRSSHLWENFHIWKPLIYCFVRRLFFLQKLRHFESATKIRVCTLFVHWRNPTFSTGTLTSLPGTLFSSLEVDHARLSHWYSVSLAIALCFPLGSHCRKLASPDSFTVPRIV